MPMTSPKMARPMPCLSGCFLLSRTATIPWRCSRSRVYPTAVYGRSREAVLGPAFTPGRAGRAEWFVSY
jgi:hypothetical protein